MSIQGGIAKLILNGYGDRLLLLLLLFVPSSDISLGIAMASVDWAGPSVLPQKMWAYGFVAQTQDVGLRIQADRTRKLRAKEHRLLAVLVVLSKSQLRIDGVVREAQRCNGEKHWLVAPPRSRIVRTKSLEY